MKRRLAIALALVLVLALLASAALAAWPGDPLWKQECPPWGTLQITTGLAGWVGVECYTFDATER
jgi:hypothetical protein